MTMPYSKTQSQSFRDSGEDLFLIGLKISTSMIMTTILDI